MMPAPSSARFDAIISFHYQYAENLTFQYAQGSKIECTHSMTSFVDRHANGPPSGPDLPYSAASGIPLPKIRASHHLFEYALYHFLCLRLLYEKQLATNVEHLTSKSRLVKLFGHRNDRERTERHLRHLLVVSGVTIMATTAALGSIWPEPWISVL